MAVGTWRLWPGNMDHGEVGIQIMCYKVRAQVVMV